MKAVMFVTQKSRAFYATLAVSLAGAAQQAVQKAYIFDLNPRPADHNRRIANAGRASEEMRNVA